MAALISPMAYMWLILILFPGGVSLSFSLFRPYKINFFNISDCLAFAIITLTNFLIVYATRVSSFPIQLLYFMGVIPFLYFTLILYKILSRVALFSTCCSRIVKRFQPRNQNQRLHIQGDENTDEALPDRIVNPDVYQPLLPVTRNREGNSQSDYQPQAGVNSMVAYGSI